MTMTSPIRLIDARLLVATSVSRAEAAAQLCGQTQPRRLCSLEVDAELAQFDDRRLRQRIVSGENGSVKGIPFCLAERLAVAQDVVVAGRRLDGEADGLRAGG